MRDFFTEHDLWEYWRHHTGHAKSTLVHEAPFLDIGDDRIMEVGMVFTVEPGIYLKDFAGFRHSDTVAVTRGRHRVAHLLPARPGEPDNPGLTSSQ